MMTFVVLAAVTALPPQSAAPAPVAPSIAASDLVYRQLLDAHNRERALVGVPPLQWDASLAQAAKSYGPALAASGRLEHSPRGSRPGQHENLWRGTASAFLPAQMVGSWIAEKRYFRPSIFPGVSTTGNWMDVSHYTTMIWPTTTRVGCAVYPTPRWDYLICRYSPPGNVDGKSVP